MATNYEIQPDPQRVSADRDVSPRTQGLALFIQEAVAQLHNTSEDSKADTSAFNDSLLFLGNWHDSHPRLLFHDPVLEPVDKVVWAVIRHHANAGDPTAFPSYEEIARLANIGSKATVSRAIMILRTTRWISLCARVRDDKGRFQGNVYALHDEPISVGDAMHLDPEYIKFLQEMQTHHHDRVRKVATAALATIEEAIEAGTDVTQETTLHRQHERRLAALRSPENSGQPEGFYSVSGQALETLATPDEDLEAVVDQQRDTDDPVQNLNSATQVQELNTADEDRVQNLNAAPQIEEKQADTTRVQNLNSVPVCSSSSFYIKTTTTTTPQVVKPPSAPKREIAGGELHVPQQLSADEVILARMYLGRIGSEQRQDVLDELQGRLGNAAKGGQPIRNPIGYLAQLCNAVKTEMFQLTSFGLQVRQAREQAAAREKAEAVKEKRHRQELLAQPPPKSPLVDKLMAIRQQAHGRQQPSETAEC